MIRSIAVAGLTCGVLDGLSAVVLFGWFGATPTQVFQGIARGALGPSIAITISRLVGRFKSCAR